MSDEFIETLLSGFEEVSTPLSHVMTGWMGGAIDRVAPGDDRLRPPRARTRSPGSSAARARSRSSLPPTGCAASGSAPARFADEGVYVNALDSGRSVREAYAEGVWERLVEIKHRYDPDGVFAGNGIG